MVDAPPFLAPHRANRNCCYCHHLLAPTEVATGICARPECQTRHRMAQAAKLAQKIEADEAANAVLARKRVRSAVKQAARDIGHPDLRKIVHGLAPYIDIPSVPLPKERRIAFEAHLRAIVDESFNTADGVETFPEPPEDDPDYRKRRVLDQPEPFAANAACIACQGDCCLTGGPKNAYLTRETINYVRWSSPNLSAQNIVDMYLSFLPDQSASGSCVFHGEQGCTVPRQVRADICNSFQCRARSALKTAVERRPGKAVVVAGLSEDHGKDPSAGAPYLRVVSISEDQEVRIHPELRLSRLPKGSKKS